VRSQAHDGPSLCVIVNELVYGRRHALEIIAPLRPRAFLGAKCEPIPESDARTHNTDVRRVALAKDSEPFCTGGGSAADLAREREHESLSPMLMGSVSSTTTVDNMWNQCILLHLVGRIYLTRHAISDSAVEQTHDTARMVKLLLSIPKLQVAMWACCLRYCVLAARRQSGWILCQERRIPG